MINLNVSLSTIDEQYQGYKKAADKQAFLSTHWLHTDGSVTVKSWIGKWLDKCCLTRFLYRKFYRIDLQATYTQLSQMKTDTLAPAKQKQLKHACKLLACFGRTKLKWKEDGEQLKQLTHLNTLLKPPKKTEEAPPTIEELLKDLWSADDEHKKDLKYWSKRVLKTNAFVQDPCFVSIEKRGDWIKQGLDQYLGWCGCHFFSPDIRVDIEKEIIAKLAKQFPSASHPELKLMSFGSGSLLQDWVLLNEIAQLNYKKIHVQLVDPCTGAEHVEALNKLAQELARVKNIEIQIDLASDVKNVLSSKKFDFIYAIDFKDESWEDFTEVVNYLTPSGFIYSAIRGSRLSYHNQTQQWDMERYRRLEVPSSVKTGDTVHIAIQNLDDFWMHDFGLLVDLVARKVKRIQIDLLGKSWRDTLVLNKVLSKLLPVQIDLRFTQTVASDTYHFVTIPAGKISRDNAPQLLQGLKSGGALLLEGSTYCRIK